MATLDRKEYRSHSTQKQMKQQYLPELQKCIVLYIPQERFRPGLRYVILSNREMCLIWPIAVHQWAQGIRDCVIHRFIHHIFNKYLASWCAWSHDVLQWRLPGPNCSDKTFGGVCESVGYSYLLCATLREPLLYLVSQDFTPFCPESKPLNHGRGDRSRIRCCRARHWTYRMCTLWVSSATSNPQAFSDLDTGFLASKGRKSYISSKATSHIQAL